MSDLGHLKRAASLPDVLLELDEEFARVLLLLDAPAAIQRLVLHVPELTGVETAFIGELDGGDQMVLHHPVNLSNMVEGLNAPIGASLGGRVFAARRPLWTSDYRSASGITPRFKTQADAEGLVAIIAVPIIHQDRVLGVVYGGNRSETDFGDRTAGALEAVAARMATAQVVAERARHAAEVAVHEERRRLALELHDNVGAVLFTLRAGIQRLRDEPQLDTEVQRRLGAIEQHAVEASAALRGSMRVLHAPPEQAVLGVALREHCRAFSERTGVAARIITVTELPPLSRARVGVLADAAREALLNVEKHAQAQSVVVSVFTVRSGLAVSVSDNGVGLKDDYTHRDGLGLASMAERLARVGGAVTIGSNEDGGATVQAWIPT
jgi:signal transduction histidine kinase